MTLNTTNANKCPNLTLLINELTTVFKKQPINSK